MQLGMIGLGRMGSNIAKRLVAAGHDPVVYDLDPEAVAAVVDEGAVGAFSVEDLVARLEAPRAVWVMVPAAAAGAVIDEVSACLEAGDVVIDGGNSFYEDDISRSAALAQLGITLLDVGTSGGVHGLERGYCLMIGGDLDAYERLEPIFAALAPGVDAAARTPGRRGSPSPAENGYLHCGPVGAGHFVKMVHNGIEYGLMAAYAEGLNILEHAGVGMSRDREDAETAPLRNPASYRYRLDIAAIAELWRRGSVVGSWLLDLTAAALFESPELSEYSGRVADSGEGRWTLSTAVEEGVPAPVLAAALFGRFDSRGRDDFANRVLSAMRDQFGGHQEQS